MVVVDYNYNYNNKYVVMCYFILIMAVRNQKPENRNEM